MGFRKICKFTAYYFQNGQLPRAEMYLDAKLFRWKAVEMNRNLQKPHPFPGNIPHWFMLSLKSDFILHVSCLKSEIIFMSREIIADVWMTFRNLDAVTGAWIGAQNSPCTMKAQSKTWTGPRLFKKY